MTEISFAMADFEAEVQAAINSGKINGAILCAANLDNSFARNRALGQRTLLTGEKCPQRADDVLYVASGTKLLTTIAALQCVEDGLISLEGDISSIAPELAAKKVITGFSADGSTQQLEPIKRPITLEMLLTHSAGTSYEVFDPLLAEYNSKYNKPVEGEQRPVEKAYDYPLNYQPGQGWSYGVGLDWAGRIVERLTGRTLGDYMQRRIFSPLGINDAQFFPVTREDLRSRMIDLNPNDPEGLGIAVLPGAARHTRNTGHFGGHGLFMTGIDYVRILQSLLANDGKLLQQATVEDMFSHRLPPEATSAHQAALSGPMGHFLRLGISESTKVGIGLGGLLTLENIHDLHGENTLTWGGGLTFIWFVDRKNHFCGIGAVQSALPIDAEVTARLKDSIRKAIYRDYSVWRQK